MFETFFRNRELKAALKPLEEGLRLAGARLKNCEGFEQNITFIADSIDKIRIQGKPLNAEAHLEGRHGWHAVTDLKNFVMEITSLSKNKKIHGMSSFNETVLNEKIEVTNVLKNALVRLRRHRFSILPELEAKGVSYRTLWEHTDLLGSQIEDSGLRKACMTYKNTSSIAAKNSALEKTPHSRISAIVGGPLRQTE